MLYKEIISVYFENHTEHITALSGQNSEFSHVKAGGTYNNHHALRDRSYDIYSKGTRESQ
jgi:hypothetical protein